MIPEVHERLPHTKGMITGPKISMVEGRLSASIKDSFFFTSKSIPQSTILFGCRLLASHIHTVISFFYTNLMHEPKVQSFHALVLSVDNVVVLLLLGHRIPLPVSNLVAPYVEGLDQEEQHDVEAANAE